MVLGLEDFFVAIGIGVLQNQAIEFGIFIGNFRFPTTGLGIGIGMIALGKNGLSSFSSNDNIPKKVVQ